MSAGHAAGIYLRLSKDDERAGESVSIENQRLLLTKYVQENGWTLMDTYIDDGWSGTNFQRPAFQRMLRDAADKRINLIVVKDLSRLGRNYIEAGRLTDEVFPALGCRFIALNDAVDTMQGDNDMMAYRNLFNEFFSKDTSKKVRAVKQSYMRQGKYLGAYAPLGYQKDPLNKHRLAIDEETAPTIRRIFAMRCAGSSFRSIALMFNDERVPSPKQTYYRRAGRDNPCKENGLWSESSVKAILRSEVYIGNLVQGKSGTVSYKNHKLIAKPEEQWIRVEHTHEPLIDMEAWNTVQSLDAKRFKPRKPAATKLPNQFAGLLKCADCGFHMRVNSRYVSYKDGGANHYISYMCGNYARSGKTACSVHSIRETALSQLVLDELRRHTTCTGFDEQRVMSAVRLAQARENGAYLTVYRHELKACENRLAQLEQVIQMLYEDRAHAVVTEGMFGTLMGKYEKERIHKSEAVRVLREKLEACACDSGDASSWHDVIRGYAALETLTQALLLALVDGIEVFETEKTDAQQVCRIHIKYRFAAVAADLPIEGDTHGKAV